MVDYTELIQNTEPDRNNQAYTRISGFVSDTWEYKVSASDFFSILQITTIITFVILLICTVFGLIFVNQYTSLTFDLCGRALLIIGVAFVGYIMTMVLYFWSIPQKTYIKATQKVTWFIFTISLCVLWLSGLLLFTNKFEEAKSLKF